MKPWLLSTFFALTLAAFGAVPGAASALAADAVPVSFKLPAWDNFNALTFRLLPPEGWRPFLAPSGYQQVKDGVIVLTKNAPTVGKADLPLDVPAELAPFCRAGNGIMPEDAFIQERARAIVGKENRAVPALALLAGWVYQNLALNHSAQHLSPLDALRARRGDAAAHARVFASLARSLNIPIRLCGGLLIQRDGALRHVWCEANLNGQWLPIDTTVNRIGLPAGYLLTETEEGGSGVLSGKFADAVHAGGLGLEFVSATKNYAAAQGGEPLSFTLFPGTKKTYVAFHENWLANLYWGFSIVKPEKWKGDLKLKEVTLKSPDGQAIVKVEALSAAMPCTRSQLDTIRATLGGVLPGFKVISAELVRFGARRNNAMFLDFSVAQDAGRRRCQMYVIPLRGRSYRVSVWAASERFEGFLGVFGEILATVAL